MKIHTLEYTLALMDSTKLKILNYSYIFRCFNTFPWWRSLLFSIYNSIFEVLTIVFIHIQQSMTVWSTALYDVQ